MNHSLLVQVLHCRGLDRRERERERGGGHIINTHSLQYATTVYVERFSIVALCLLCVVVQTRLEDKYTVEERLHHHYIVICTVKIHNA